MEAPRVAPDDRIEISDHCFAVPSKLIREIVAARITAATVEVFHKGSRIASRALSPVRNRHTTITEHMPIAHRRYADAFDKVGVRDTTHFGATFLLKWGLC